MTRTLISQTERKLQALTMTIAKTYPTKPANSRIIFQELSRGVAWGEKTMRQTIRKYLGDLENVQGLDIKTIIHAIYVIGFAVNNERSQKIIESYGNLELNSCKTIHSFHSFSGELVCKDGKVFIGKPIPSTPGTSAELKAEEEDEDNKEIDIKKEDDEDINGNDQLKQVEFEAPEIEVKVEEPIEEKPTVTPSKRSKIYEKVKLEAPEVKVEKHEKPEFSTVTPSNRSTIYTFLWQLQIKIQCIESSKLDEELKEVEEEMKKDSFNVMAVPISNFVDVITAVRFEAFNNLKKPKKPEEETTDLKEFFQFLLQLTVSLG
uniref:SPK domain-containing protein n=1 Tax=Caenorhabditis tropicalis TaxID=1561998 RepID=A0A1I7UU71_9PELO